ncbi:EGF-like domain-containing protein [Dictyostelium discoideum AX4]|uniref:EGF-like domain-containing protein n=1 Tax=Dictyostelium discoideum TaxID=44689 RepID=Q556M2_DICDI|nr:EGF-like domain-containing protein [Dictyostelium discoideum AX4]XP_645078.1 EGF-like domain-containing protein [Dictyostelium discoideum AX4]EAL70411.1 EGF-like domain-containing protein [Dictyostelium discoideum AX4]EAL71088.1 EGF-like domain-containing protein [Dictyostelium discoideum AX4]|eukprot:XP_644336.1 EGF-like domain-containing protein [Dictyostelium discoideum AX4]
MKLFEKIQVLILIFVSNYYFIKFSNCQIINIYDLSNNNSYIKHPQSTNSYACKFEVYLLFNVSQQDIGNDHLELFYNDPIVTLLDVLVSNSSILSLMSLQGDPGYIGVQVFSRFSLNHSINNSISLNFICQAIDYTKLDYKLMVNNRFKRSTSNYGGYLQFTSEYPLGQLEYSSNTSGVLSNTIENTANLAGGSLMYNFRDNLSVSVNFVGIYNNSIYIEYPSLYYTNIDVNSNNSIVTMYPNQVTQYNEFGFGCPPLFTITINRTTDEYQPYFYVSLINGLGTGNIQIYPLYEINKMATYIGMFDGAVTPSYYTLFSQSDNSLTEIYKVENLTVTKLKKQSFSTVVIATYLHGNNETLYNSSMYTISFNSGILKQVDFFPTVYRFQSSSSVILNWPFGFESGQNFNFNFKSSHLQNLFSINSISSFTTDKNISTTVQSDIKITPQEPFNVQLLNFELFYLFNDNYLLRFKIKKSSFDYFIALKGFSNILRYESIVEEDNEVVVFETVFDFFKNYGLGNFYIFDSLNRMKSYLVNNYYSTDPLAKYSEPSENLNNFLIENVSFKYNYIDVTNKSATNVIYFNYNGTIDPNRLPYFYLTDTVSYSDISNIQYDSIRYAIWNSTLLKYQVEFTIPANIQPGSVPYLIILNYRSKLSSEFLPLSAQLFVTSENYDGYGPIFSNIEKVNSTNEFGWKFTIDDPINGFDYADIIVRGEMDSSTYKFHLTTQNLTRGDKFNGDYQINITISSRCASQNYIITQVKLYDTQGNACRFSVSESFSGGIRNPFINYLSDSKINKLYKKCSGENDGIDSSPPILNWFNAVKKVGTNNDDQIISFDFQAADNESGLKDKQYPIVYIQTIDLQVIQGVAQIQNKTKTTVNYTCEIELPTGFGYKSDIIFSVYGFINNGGYYSGFSSDALNNLSFKYSMTQIGILRKIEIIRVSQITSSGGKLWIVGRGLNLSIRINIKYNRDSNFTQISIPTTVYSSAILIEDIKPTDEPFIIQAFDQSNNKKSKIFNVLPLTFKLSSDDSTSIDSSSSSSSSSSLTPTPTLLPPLSPIPTNKPQTCLGEPVCGGSKQGICSSSGCICYPPWIGNDCNSQVIIIPQPSTNTSQPSTELPIIDNNNQTSNSTNYLFKSLISIVSLRELDFNSNQVNLYTFDKWIYTPINNIKSQYFTSIQSGDPKSTNPLTTNITVTLEWFNQTKIIQFANSNITMNPSSIKYTIEITEYKFLNQLNSLQLVMSALFESSNSKDTCSLKEFGDTSDGDNSNFFKIQIDDHSLYGRFIKRAIIDSKVSSIENQLLDSKMNSIQTSSISQSFIGITIPNYKQSIIIDPDFSVLVDSKPVSNNDNNSICTSNKSKLTSAQLAGIIIGSVAFAAVVIVSIVYLVVKNRKSDLFLRNVQSKLQKMN